jgi:Domain of unknown function (DUF4398)
MNPAQSSTMRIAAQVILLTSSAWLLSACASTPIPKEQMAVAEAAVQHANTTNTSDHAAGQLQLAVSKLTAARAAMASKDYGQARQLAEQVEVDAQVAELHAQTVRAGKSAAEAQDAERALREEIGRKTNR